MVPFTDVHCCSVIESRTATLSVVLLRNPHFHPPEPTIQENRIPSKILGGFHKILDLKSLLPDAKLSRLLGPLLVVGQGDPRSEKFLCTVDGKTPVSTRLL